jgi:deoxyribodipyrimidine photo-lyase
MTAILWFKRDLRVTDHAALTLAAKGPVIPLYIVEPDLWAQPDAAARHWDFIAESLAELRQDLAALGAPLVVRQGEAVEILARLARSHGVTEVISHQDPGTDWSRARDRRVAAWAASQALNWTVLPSAHEVLPAPPLHGPAIAPGPIPTAQGLGLAPDPCPHRQAGGRAQGLLLLNSFLATRGAAYREAPLSPLLAERASSRLSPHLAWGTLSQAEVSAAAAETLATPRPAPWPQALAAFRRRLVLPLPPLTELRSQGAATHLAAFQSAQTGLPFVDACLRALHATGWLSAPLRAMLASVAALPLGLDPAALGASLARAFTDYDPALHWPNLQRHASPQARLIDPLRLAQAQDPTGAFTRRWLPELAEVPLAHLQEPWKWSGARRILGRRYPEAVVDLVSATRALRAERSATRPHRPRRTAFAVIEPRPSAQLSFDL